MLVRELIKELKKCEQDAPVVIVNENLEVSLYPNGFIELGKLKVIITTEVEKEKT